MEINMNQLTKIVIDTRGGDKGASAMVAGAAAALDKYPELGIVLVGDQQEIDTLCASLSMPSERLEILHAAEEITNHDSPAEALFQKQDSSMLKALQALSERKELFGLITTGNTGVLLAGAMRYLSGKNRVRPALAAVLPAQSGGFTCLVDTGATVDCTPPVLHHFARLGSDFMRDMYGLVSPKIGLLSNGAESSKGNKLVKETHVILAQDDSLCFVGNIEGNEALSGKCDVLVCDGFAGNQVLKVTEGTATRIITDIMKYAYKTGSGEIKTLASHLMSIYDIGSLGGGIILGVEKPVIKARGNAGPDAVVNTAGMLLNMSRNQAVFDAAQNHI
ncbi:MAG: phosphate--acyl-ACP acyltransferase [Ruminococcaceae bacterium]|nr:phosphate--acyl-ACP acyltransferase [Oscillospiraceae bacterium]